uniref:CEP1-DNA_bind domain-containing protein n=1 Tax=Caenorhabditis tropicalis TaxID=1561998 RepID=A0A1I7UL40_9PELO
MNLADSQLSDLIRQGRMIDSQETEGNRTQELSQGTIQRIIDDQFTPIMTQQSEEGIILNGGGTNRDELASTSFFGPARHTGLKRRTPRIQDRSCSKPDGEEEIIDFNLSNDLFCDNVESDGQANSSLLNESIISNTTFSQIQCGSQNIEYLRDRTPQEQEKRMNERYKEAEEKRAKDQQKQNKINKMSEMMTQREYDIDDNNMDFVESREISKEEGGGREDENMEPDEEEEEEFMRITVLHDKASRQSDLAYMETGNNKKHLWAKMNCKVPIALKWKIDSRRVDKKLWLRVRLVNYQNNDVSRSLRDPTTDVLKCLHHINEERLDPPESYFYVINSNLPWKCRVSDLRNGKGRHFIVQVDPNTTEATFDVMFMCQKNCMVVEDKRKPMSLAVLLEDRIGQAVMYAAIEDVQIVGYPSRDYRNFCSKLKEFHFPERSSFKSSMNQLQPAEFVRKNQYPVMEPHSSNMYTSMETSSIATSSAQQMFPSTPNSRKRGATEYVPMRMSSQLPSKSTEYARRLHGCEPKFEQMEWEYDINDNQQSTSSKRCRQTIFPYKSLQLSEEEYYKVVKFLSDDALETQKKWETTTRFTGGFCSKDFRLDDQVERFLSSVGLVHEVHLFKVRNIYTMEDLKREFERDYDIFEKIGVESSKLKNCYEVFLNFYRIQEGYILNNPSLQQ